MSPPSLENYLLVGALLFGLGLLGFLSRRNLIVMFLSAETMLQGVALNLVAFARYRGEMGGQVFVLFILTVAACEAALALAFILILLKRRQSLDVSLWRELRDPETDGGGDEEPMLPVPPAPSYPRLPPAGQEPPRREEEITHV
jgi:NADH-quinone oxidoreductase subunit K